MHTEIARTANQIFALLDAQRAYLAGKPDHYLVALVEESEGLRGSVNFSERAAAEINRAAAVLTLESRR